MFSTSEQISRAMWALCEAHVTALTNYVNAAIEAGVHAADVNADAVRTALASNTVLARQWLGPSQVHAWAIAPRTIESNTTLGQAALQLEQ
jgi:hypothetical protein